jgi:hypothetical protein
MDDSKYLAWSSFNIVSVAVILAVLAVFDPLGVLANRRGAVYVATALSGLAALLGFAAFKTDDAGVEVVLQVRNSGPGVPRADRCASLPFP